ncbi:MAG: multicopper oxidase domain-containing protein [bacterium]|nr:multicopper oxidase domain-containing protein [bacterium]
MNKLLVIAALFGPFSIFAQTPLYIPPTIETSTIDLTLQEGTTQFYNGVTTNTMGANGSLLGPTLILQKDDFVTINVNNQLGEETTIHWHGLHVAPENDGGPHSIIPDGTTWSPQFTVLDQAGINWYHPHLHSTTNEHVSKGIAGLILVKDQEEAALNLPRDYGIDDFPVIVQTKGFDANGQIEWMSELDTSLMVNGTIDAYLDAPAQIVRLRVLNGASQRFFKFGFSNNLSFQLIGTDGGLLEAPVTLTRYQMGPGQRADILIDLSGLQGQNVQLMNYGTEIANAIYGATQPGMMPQLMLPGYDQNPLNGSDFTVLDIQVGAPTANPVTSVPNALTTHVIPQEGTEDITRNLLFQTQQNIVGPFTINGSLFDMNVINYTVPLGNREIWSLTNQTPIAHPFHIHDVQFYILDINGNPPPPELSGLNDVVMVPAGMGNVRFIADFLDHANDSIPYMYHCHMLTHEDEGMMGQFLVTDPNAGINSNVSQDLEIFPNPVADMLTLKAENIIDATIYLVDIAGKKTQLRPAQYLPTSVEVDLSEFASGMYLIQVEIAGSTSIQRVEKF